MKDQLRTSGVMWRLFGYTRAHFWAVIITSNLLGVLGIAVAAWAFLAPEGQALRLALLAITLLLLECATLLHSVVMLMFYSQRFSASEPGEQ